MRRVRWLRFPSWFRTCLAAGAATAAVVACGANPPPEPATASGGAEIDLSRPGRERPAWPPGLVPCAKDAPEGTGCAVAAAASAPAAPDSNVVWHVPVGPADPMRGPAGALVTLVVFSDFECPFCKRVNPVLDRILADLPEEARLVWKDLPLPMHAHAESAAELARVARERLGDAGFWKAHDLLYASQDRLGEATFRRIAEQLGIPWTPAWAAIRGARFGAKIQQDVALSDRVKVEATPTTFINGIKLVGALPYERTRAVVDAQLEKARALVQAGTPRAGVYAAIIAKGVEIQPNTDTAPP